MGRSDLVSGVTSERAFESRDRAPAAGLSQELPLDKGMDRVMTI